MITVAISSSTNPFFSPPATSFSSVISPRLLRIPWQPKHLLLSSSSSSSTAARAVDPETNASSDTTETTPSSSAEDDGDSFENRIARMRIKYRSGTGKKAEVRKSKKSSSSSSKSKKGGVFLPPVPLKEAVSEGLKVDFGFSPYTERLNGRLAGLGLVALLLVELGSGKSLISYHTPAVLFIQVYSIAAASALYVKYHKEKISIWPQGSSSSSSKNS